MDPLYIYVVITNVISDMFFQAQFSSSPIRPNEKTPLRRCSTAPDLDMLASPLVSPIIHDEVAENNEGELLFTVFLNVGIPQLLITGCQTYKICELKGLRKLRNPKCT